MLPSAKRGPELGGDGSAYPGCSSDICRRFQNKRSKDFKPSSLDMYKKTFARAVKMFLEYANEPSAWRAPLQERALRKDSKPTPIPRKSDAASILDKSPNLATASDLVEYPFPLRERQLAYLKLPSDLNTAEVKHLTAYLATLAVDGKTA